MAPKTPFDIVPFDAAEHLKDEKSIAACLNASREMNDPAVLRNALSTVARARSMTDLAQACGLGRESLYKALRPGAKPRYETVLRVMEALGVEMVFQARQQLGTVARQAAAMLGATKKEAVELVRSKLAPKDTSRTRRTKPPVGVERKSAGKALVAIYKTCRAT